jgi:hypothetical protein
VNLETAIYNYKKYQINGIPCGYILVLIYVLYLSSSDYFSAALSVETWIATYDTVISVVNTENLKFDDDNEYNPPQTRHTRGRPKKKREDRAIYRAIRGLRDTELEMEETINENGLAMRPKAYYRTYYGTCGETGYNTRTCRQPHQ